MARTKQEIRQWLDSQVSKSLAKPNGEYKGECVSFVQQLLAFLGASSGNVAMGHAKDFGNSLVNKGIANRGSGWLNVAVNPNMGGGYGHVWADVQNEANYEQNGSKARTVTKNTRPIAHATQIINLDKWVTPDASKSHDQIAIEVIAGKWGNGVNRTNKLKAAGYDPASIQALVNAKLRPAPLPSAPAVPAQKSVRIVGDYRTLYKTPGGAKLATLAPNQFGGLTYKILERSGNWVKIPSQQFGQGWIWAGPDVAHLTKFI